MQGRERQALWDIHHRKHFETGFLLAGKLHILKQIFSLTITIRCQGDVLSPLAPACAGEEQFPFPHETHRKWPEKGKRWAPIFSISL